MSNAKQSIRARLLVGTALWVSVGLAVSAALLSQIFHEQVKGLLAQELQGHLDELSILAVYDGRGQLRLSHPLSDARFVPMRSGFYWQIKGSDGAVLRSASLAAGDLDLTPRRRSAAATTLRLSKGPNGPVYQITAETLLAGAGKSAVIAIASDVRVADGIVKQLNMQFIKSLLIICIGLIGASWASIYFALKPVSRVREALAAVHSGTAKHLPDDLPLEVSDLAGDVNRLIDAQEETTRRARAEAGRLAHALKTPLAILVAEGKRLGAHGQDAARRVIDEQCERMRRQVEHQMAVARVAGTAGWASSHKTDAEPAARDVILALARLYEDRGLNFELDCDPGILVACDREDFAEMIGNLVDNAAKWAAKIVQVRIYRGISNIVVKVGDDGPGVPKVAEESAFLQGARLSDSKPGHGLGLSIVRNLVEAYGGQCWIEPSGLGGTAVRLLLPEARAG